MLWKRTPLTPVHYSTILGVAWNPISDELVFDIRGMVSDLRTNIGTNQEEHSGFFLQSVGNSVCSDNQPENILPGVKVNWDEPLPSELLCKWQCLVSNFQVVLSIPRYSVRFSQRLSFVWVF